MFFVDTMQFRTENRIDALMCGVILALLLQKEEIRDWMKQRLSLVTLISLLTATAAGVLIFSEQPVRRSIISAALPLLLAHTVIHPERWWSRWLENPPLRWIGRCSYSIYIWQMLFLVPNVRRLGWLQGFPQALVFILLVAAISYYLVEKPMIRLGHRISGSPASLDANASKQAKDKLSVVQT